MTQESEDSFQGAPCSSILLVMLVTNKNSLEVSLTAVLKKNTRQSSRIRTPPQYITLCAIQGIKYFKFPKDD